PFSFSWYTSSSESVVFASGSQLIIRCPRYIYPCSYQSTNTRITDADISSSSVNFVLSQSQEEPKCFNWSRIIPPCLCVHSHACSKNSSLVRSDFFIPFLASISTTLASVAIEA